MELGRGPGLDTFVYMTIGTGIGGGGLVGGKLLHGLIHPEMGHMRIPHDLVADPFPGSCPFHGDCLEGLACGPAIGALEQAAETLPPDHPAWALEAHYLALALHNLVCTVSPERIVLGGGVMEAAHLLPLVRHQLQALIHGYIQAPELDRDVASYVVVPVARTPCRGDRRTGAGGARCRQGRRQRRAPSSVLSPWSTSLRK